MSRGWALEAKRLIEQVPLGHWHTTAVLCCLRCSGPVAPLVAIEAIPSVNACARYLPPHSPDLKPIEYMFANLKRLIRKSGKRILQALWKEIGELLDYFELDECWNYVQDARYTKL